MLGFLTKGVVIVLAAVFVVVTLAMGAIFNDTWREHERYEQRKAALREELTTSRAALDQDQERLRLLTENPQYIEHVIREQLGYAREGEKVFRFDEER